MKKYMFLAMIALLSSSFTACTEKPMPYPGTTDLTTQQEDVPPVLKSFNLDSKTAVIALRDRFKKEVGYLEVRMVVRPRIIYNPTTGASYQQFPGSNGDCVSTVTFCRPKYYDSNGRPVSFTYNPGQSAGSGKVYIVEVQRDANGVFMPSSVTLTDVTAYWNPIPNPSSWVEVPWDYGYSYKRSGGYDQNLDFWSSF